MKNLKKLAAISAVSILFANSAYAEQADRNIAVGANIGTLGLGIEARMPIVDTLVGRIGINLLPYSTSVKTTSTFTQSAPFFSQTYTSEIHTKVKGKLLTVPLMLDWHPIDDSGFRVSAGVAYNGTRLKSTSKVSDFTLGGNKVIMIKGNQYDATDLSVSTKV